MLCFFSFFFLVSVSPTSFPFLIVIGWSAGHIFHCRQAQTRGAAGVHQHKLGWHLIPVNHSRAWMTSQTLWERAQLNPLIREHVIAINLLPSLSPVSGNIWSDLSFRISVCSAHEGCLYIQHKCLDIIKSSHYQRMGQSRFYSLNIQTLA